MPRVKNKFSSYGTGGSSSSAANGNVGVNYGQSQPGSGNKDHSSPRRIFRSGPVTYPGGYSPYGMRTTDIGAGIPGVGQTTYYSSSQQMNNR